MSWLKGQLQPEDTLLPLTLNTFVSLKDLFPRVESVEDRVPYAEIWRLASRSCEINQSFSAESCQGATFDGYDWPRICCAMQDYFFRDILLAEAISASLRTGGFDRILWVGYPGRDPFLVSPTSNVMASALSFYLKDRFDVLRPPHRVWAPVIGRCHEKMRNGVRLLRKKMTFSRGIQISRCQVIAIFPPTEEWVRFSEALTELHREYGKAFQLWSVGLYSANMETWASKEGVEIVWVPYPDRVGKEVMSFFRRRWNRWCAGGRQKFAETVGCPVLASEELEYHFKFYFTSVWPRTAEYARILEKYLCIASPEWLVGSTNPIAPQLFPYNVASKLGIRSIAMPHGYVQVGDARIESTLLACRNRFERAHFVRSFPDENRVLYCRNAGNELSYQVKDEKGCSAGQKKMVALLTSDPDVSDAFMSMADRRSFIQAFEQLADLPEDLADLEFVVKSHPRWDLSAFFRSLRFPANMRVVDPKASLVELTKRAWAIVMFNHFGSATVHAIRSEKPILFLNSAGLFWPHTEWLAFPAGEVVEDVPSLLNLLRRLKGSTSLYQELLHRCQRFKAEHLGPVETTVGQCMRMLEEREVYRLSTGAMQPMPSF